MPVDIRLPNINAKTEAEQQIRSYLIQLAEQLQWALQNVDTSNNSVVVNPTPKSLISSSQINASAEATFGSIKALIIKSAEIVNAYYDEINKRLEGAYVAQSDFGTYKEQTAQTITENSRNTTQRFESVQTILTEQGSNITEIEGSIEDLDGELDGVDSDLQDSKGSIAGLGEGLNDTNTRIAEVNSDLQNSKEVINSSIQGVQDGLTGANALLEDAKSQLQGSIDDLEVYITKLQNVIIGVTAYVKSGLLYYTDAEIPVYGLEIGQTVKDEVSGTEVFNKYARFTSEKLSFYDNNGNEVAYISDKKLFIRMAHITICIQVGGIISLVMANGDVVEKWVGG